MEMQLEALDKESQLTSPIKKSSPSACRRASPIISSSEGNEIALRLAH